MPSPLFEIVAILDIIWHIALFFVPFLIMMMNGRLKRMEENSAMALEIALRGIDDANLTRQMLIRKYHIERSGHAYYVNGGAAKSLESAIAHAKAGTRPEGEVDVAPYSGI